MGKTVIEKIIEHNTGKEVKPGDIVTVNVDRVMIHDIFIPFVAEKFRKKSGTRPDLCFFRGLSSWEQPVLTVQSMLLL